MNDKNKTCSWNRVADSDTYESECDHNFYFANEVLADMPDFKWCPYCRLLIKAFEPNNEIQR